MNTTREEWVECTKCIHFEDCETKEDRDGCYFGETERIARWKGAGMGEYYCSLCCETVSGNRERECPNCGAQMYTDEEWAQAKAWWALEDSICDILPDELTKCKYCDDKDMLYDIVCYLPTENGSSISIPMNHCPACGRKLTEEE